MQEHKAADVDVEATSTCQRRSDDEAPESARVVVRSELRGGVGGMSGNGSWYP